MAYFDPYNVQNPPENCCVQQSVGPPFIKGSPITPKYKRGGGIALNLALSPRKPRSKHQPSPVPTTTEYH